MYLAPCHTASACYSQDLSQSGCRIKVLRLPLRSIILASLKSAKQQAISMIMFHFIFSEYSISEVFTVWNQWGFWAVKWILQTLHTNEWILSLGVCSTPVYQHTHAHSHTHTHTHTHTLIPIGFVTHFPSNNKLERNKILLHADSIKKILLGAYQYETEKP